ncbi:MULTISPECIES: transaldolase family protein [Actinosynnema]|uniref:transaldolase family protein n=1 Tax=Actinosynnema TaxID=40566 RepID=UPI0020A2B422|nr:transaldolase family protein [Actinosynnema pretiosum]MCP2098729.1 transaldolase [Actinosynnema pretiosum]
MAGRALLIDSADLDDVASAAALGFVSGVTTNPTLMRRATAEPLKHLGELLAASGLPEVYYQPTGARGPLLDEAVEAWSLDPDRVVLKVPATPSGAPLARELVSRGARVALTAAQDPVAMAVAEAIGCHAVIPYVDRALRDPRVASELVRDLVALRTGPTLVVAASVKSAGQLTRALADGADAVTAPLDVLAAVLGHPAPLEAERAFEAEYAAEPGTDR